MIKIHNELSAVQEAVSDNVSAQALLCQLAEEASELSMAAMKVMRAAYLEDNPTPVTKEAAIQNLEEEIGDVLVAIDAILANTDLQVSNQQILKTYNDKFLRWLHRIHKNSGS